jgi:hypothetical protein
LVFKKEILDPLRKPFYKRNILMNSAPGDTKNLRSLGKGMNRFLLKVRVLAVELH